MEQERYCETKEEFINYCKGKIADLGTITHEWYNDEQIESPIVMVGDIREQNGAYIVVPEESDGQTLTVVSPSGELLYDTPMCDAVDYAFRLQFSKIDRDFYENTIMKYWDEYSEVYCNESVKVDTSKMNIKEELNKLDMKSLDEDTQFLDLRNMYEAVQPRMSADEKQELKALISTTDDPNTIATYLTSKYSQQEGLEEDIDNPMVDWRAEEDNERFPSHRYEKIKSKSVEDWDGFNTEYSMYYDTVDDKYVFIFGDSDVYDPDNTDTDWECETEEEANDWFDDYKGFGDVDESLTEEKGFRGLSARDANPYGVPLYMVRDKINQFEAKAKKQPYFVAKFDKWYDPEGLDIQDKGYNIQYAGTEEDCLYDIEQIKANAQNDKYGDMKIEASGKDFVTIYYPHAIAKATFQVVKNPDYEELGESKEPKEDEIKRATNVANAQVKGSKYRNYSGDRIYFNTPNGDEFSVKREDEALLNGKPEEEQDELHKNFFNNENLEENTKNRIARKKRQKWTNRKLKNLNKETQQKAEVEKENPDTTSPEYKTNDELKAEQEHTVSKERKKQLQGEHLNDINYLKMCKKHLEDAKQSGVQENIKYWTKAVAQAQYYVDNPVDESLNEEEENKPFTYTQMVDELKYDLAHNNKGTFAVYFPEEKEHCKKILTRKGFKFEVSENNDGWYQFEYWKEDKKQNESLRDEIHSAHEYMIKKYGDNVEDALNAYVNVNPSANVYFSQDGCQEFLNWAKDNGYQLNSYDCMTEAIDIDFNKAYDEDEAAKYGATIGTSAGLAIGKIIPGKLDDLALGATGAAIGAIGGRHMYRRNMRKQNQYNNKQLMGEDYTEDNEDWGTPFTADEIEAELADLTNNYQEQSGAMRTMDDDHKVKAVEILKKMYKVVEVSDGRTQAGEPMSWVIAYSHPKQSEK